MKSVINVPRLVLACTGFAFALSCQAQPAAPGFNIRDLGVVGSNPNQPGQPFVISNSGWVAGGSLVGGAEHAVLYRNSVFYNIGGHGLGENSIAFGVNDSGYSVGETEDNAAAPTSEDFCGFVAMGFATKTKPCLPFVSYSNRMFALPTLGGANGVANQINSVGAIVGYAETRNKDAGCAAPQTNQFKPVVWFNGSIGPLPTGGDPDGVAFSINEHGQMVGATGACAPFNPIWLFNLAPAHAVLWQGGRATDLGNLGGAMNNLAHSINNYGAVVGGSDLSGDETSHAFLWTPEKKMVDLGTLAGDFWSVGLGINDQGQIVGASANADFSVLRAFLRKDGQLYDLNSLKNTGATSLYLETACSINARGQLIGLAIDLTSGAIHAYQADPLH